LCAYYFFEFEGLTDVKLVHICSMCALLLFDAVDKFSDTNVSCQFPPAFDLIIVSCFMCSPEGTPFEDGKCLSADLDPSRMVNCMCKELVTIVFY